MFLIRCVLHVFSMVQVRPLFLLDQLLLPNDKGFMCNYGAF